MEQQKITSSHKHQCRGHIVQFYNDDRYLTGAVCEFVKQGLERKEAVVVFCTEEHWQMIKKDLLQSCVLFSSDLLATQVLHFDAHEALADVLDAEACPDQERFQKLVGGVYANLKPRFERVRFYGELVDILCSCGRADDARILENYWNEFLLCHLDCSLLCGYATRHISRQEEMQFICSAHSDVIADENMRALEDTDELYRKIAQLELTIAVKGVEHQDQQCELEQTKAQLIQMGKLSILGELCAGVAHEINNPLAIVLGHVGQLRKVIGSPLNADIEKKITSIESASNRMAKIVKNVLRFARQEAIKRQLVAIQPVLLSAVDLSRDTLRASKINVKANFSADEVYDCMGDEGVLSQVFLNLIANARDAILAAKREDGSIEIDIRALDQRIEIVFSDNGIGMDEQLQQRIFSPFFTTKEVGKGTGLGLSFCQGFLKEHGGQITCTSEKGEGARFCVTLPRFECIAKAA